MDAQRSWPAEVFEKLYEQNPDPWRIGDSRYEQEKYDNTIVALGHRRFASALEVGCSIGALTRRLARQCGHLLAVDFAGAALAQARAACADLPQVEFRLSGIPGGFPWGSFELIVLSEILYFLDPADIRATAGHAAMSLEPGGVLLMVNYLGATDTPCDGDQAAELFIAAIGPEIRPVVQQRTEFYRLDLLQASPTP